MPSRLASLHRAGHHVSTDAVCGLLEKRIGGGGGGGASPLYTGKLVWLLDVGRSMLCG